MIKVFTHNDLDGVASPIVLENALKAVNLTNDLETYDVSYCSTGSYGTINTEISEYIETKHEDLNSIFILDTAPTEEVLLKLITYCNSNGLVLQVIDHHLDSVVLAKKYPDYVVGLVSDVKGKQYSATSLIFHNFIGMSPDDFIDQFSNLAYEEGSNLEHNIKIAEFASIVCSWDTWAWHNDENDKWGILAKQFNNLLYAISREEFVNQYRYNPSTLVSPTNKFLLNFLDSQEESYIEHKLKKATFGSIKLESKPLTYAFVSAEQYSSTLGNRMCTLTDENENEVDFAVIFNNGNLSFRATKPEMDVSVVAKAYFNGGGHKHASGGTLATFNAQEVFENHYKTQI